MSEKTILNDSVDNIHNSIYGQGGGYDQRLKKMFAEKTNITPLENKQIRDSVDKWADEELTRRKNVESDILNKDINTIQDRYSHVLDEITDHLKGVKSSLDEKISYNRSQIDKWKEDINALTSKYNIGKPGYGIGYKAYELAKEIVDIDMKPLKDPVGDMERIYFKGKT